MRKSRMSLGGGARSNVLRDGASRYNSSIGHGEASQSPSKSSGILLDGGSSYLSSSTASRRQSMGGGSLRSETPNRRAMLQKWRDQRRQNEPIDMNVRKRTAPPLPPSVDSRKMHKKTAFDDSENHYYPNSSQSILLNDDEMTFESSQSGSGVLSRTPPRRRGNLGSARRKSIMPRVVMPSSNEDTSLNDHRNVLSQLTIDSDLVDEGKKSQVDMEPSHVADTKELVATLDRYKQQVEVLQREKMQLTVAKAPLEARLRETENMWQKEESRLIQEIESAKASYREVDERYRDLEVKYEDVCDEVKALRQELRKASSTRQTPQDQTLWSRQLQNDRDLIETKDRLRAAEEDNDAIRLEKVSVEKELHATNIELTALIRNYDELHAEYEELKSSQSENHEAEIKLEVLATEHMATSAQLNAVCDELAATKSKFEASSQAKEIEYKKHVEELQFEISVLKTRAGRVIEQNQESQENQEEDDAVLRARIDERDRRIAELESQIIQNEQLRRQMHNTIQELRGNIRVYVRTRPFLPGDEQSNDSPVDVSPDGESVSIADRRSGELLGFKFDKVFPPSAGQEAVFSEVSDFVQSALDGYQVCLFSYGQTGSGKTHTMQGCGNGAMRGIIPRAVEQILAQAKALQSQKWEFSIHASFLEIYNENLKDLLVALRPGNDKTAAKLAIKRNREGKSYVENLTEVPIAIADSLEGLNQLESLMAVAARARSVAKTKMNSQSSRSHSVFMLHLRGYNDESGALVHGALNLCDLAGSERLDRSGAGADAARLRETQAINKSLSCLGDVFNALANGASHIPYRNSKLTYLLQDCLSGDGKALMFVNLSPTTASSGESVCSLRFAQRVNKVELGKATKRIEYSSKNKN